MTRITRRLTPSMVVASLALFLAAGGTGFALGAKTTPQARCQQGAIRGVAIVTGDIHGIANLPSDYSSDPGLFGYRWNCTGGAIQIRKSPSVAGGADIRFVGNGATNAIASVVGQAPGAASATRQPDGSFRVVTSVPSGDNPAPLNITNAQFMIVLL
jgi:hypothetical protein